MAGPYYVDISAPGPWVGKTGLDKTTNALLGLSGLQYLMDTVTVGNGPVYIKGSASDGSKLATLACDNLVGTFQRGEQVTWNAGANVGVVSELTSNYPSVIEITTGAIADLVNDDALVGGTSGATADVNGAPAQKATIIDLDTNSGTNAGGFIRYIGCKDDADYTVSYVDRAIIDANSAVGVTSIINGPARTLLWLENIEVQESPRFGFYFYYSGAHSTGCVLYNCCAHNCATYGFNSPYNITYIRCVSYSNQYGFYNNNSGGSFYCTARNNSSAGFSGSHIYVGCISHGNTGNGYDFVGGAWTLVINNVADNNDGNGIDVVAGTGLSSPFIIGNRITNQSQAGTDYGLDCSGGPVVMGWNYFEDNGDASADDIYDDAIAIELSDGSTSWVPESTTQTGTNDSGKADTDEGYVDRTNHNFATNYVDGTDPTLRRTAITIPWS